MQATKGSCVTTLTTPALDQRLKRVLRFMPAPVGIITSRDPETGAPVGLAMSALMPVSLEPCAMAICVNRSASAYDALSRSGQFCINLLQPGLEGHMTPFADPAARDARFTQPDWRTHEGTGVLYIEGGPANLFCSIRETLSYGTHDLIVGEVTDLLSNDGEHILGWGNGALGSLQPTR